MSWFQIPRCLPGIAVFLFWPFLFSQFFTYRCIYLCWFMLRPICLLSFLIECVAVKLEYLHGYLLQRWTRHPKQGSEVGSRQTLLPVTIKILVIFLDTSCIPYSSKFKNSKKDKSVMRCNSEILKEVWGGSHWILSKILWNFSITLKWMIMHFWDSESNTQFHVYICMHFGS